MYRCDFGLARTFEPPAGAYTPRVVTLWYRAPELLLGAAEYAAPVDMWAVGCILAELMLHRPLMPAPTEAKQLEMMVDLLGTPSARIWPAFPSLPLAHTLARREQPYNELPHRFDSLQPASRRPTAEALRLLNALLTYDPERRIGAGGALAHEYFATRPLPQSRARLAAAHLRTAAALLAANAAPRAAAARLKRPAPPAAAAAVPRRRSACAQSLAAEEAGEMVAAAGGAGEGEGEGEGVRKRARESEESRVRAAGGGDAGDAGGGRIPSPAGVASSYAVMS